MFWNVQQNVVYKNVCIDAKVLHIRRMLLADFFFLCVLMILNWKQSSETSPGSTVVSKHNDKLYIRYIKIRPINYVCLVAS